MTFKKLLGTASACITIGLSSACGGGGSGGGGVTTPPSPPPPPPPTGPSYTPGVFQNESNFEDRCAVPRTGVNPVTGNPYPDQAGSILFENHWLRAWTHRTYLWYDEVTDQNPANFDNPLDYFDELKTFATTASGTPKDQFHYTRDTAEYQQQVSSGSSAGYGAEFAIISGAPPREVIVAFNEPGSPAATNNLSRGAEILEIDGVDVRNGNTQADVNALNAGLFPATVGETHEFVVQDIGAANPRTISLTSANVTTAPVNRTRIVDTPSGDKVGYMLFTTFGTSIAEDALFDAVADFANQGVDELVLDLRYNGGGFLDISAELGFMIAGEAQTSGKIYEVLTFNDKYPDTNPVTGQPITPTPFYSTGQGFSVSEGTDLPSLDLPRVFILSTASTCSASEALINSLIGADVEVVLIGSRTCGKPYGFYATDNCGISYFSIQFKGANDKGFGDYADGFSPNEGSTSIGEPVDGCLIGDDYLNDLGDESEAMFATALTYIENGTCTDPSTTTKAMADLRSEAQKAQQAAWGVDLDADNPLNLLNDPRVKARLEFENSAIRNRDLAE